MKVVNTVLLALLLLVLSPLIAAGFVGFLAFRGLALGAVLADLWTDRLTINSL